MISKMKTEISYNHYTVIDGKEYYLGSSKGKAERYFSKENITVACEYCNRMMGHFENDEKPSEEFLISVKEHEENCPYRIGNNTCST